MDSCGDAAPLNPFPVAPADAPPEAVRALMRTMTRHGQPVDRELAQLLVAMVIAALAQPATGSLPGTMPVLSVTGAKVSVPPA